MSGTTSIDGLVTVFDTTEIIDKIMAVERRSVTLLEARQARANTQLAAFRALNAKLLAFQTNARTLSRPTAFLAKAVSVSDETVFTASASSSAPAGAYSLAVNTLARAHQIASQGYADTDSTTLGTGQVQIQVGDGETVTLDIDTTNNTLAGLRDAINRSDAAVSASVINDGSDAVPYRLLLTASESGADNAIAVTFDLTGGVAPEFGASSISDVVADTGNYHVGSVASGGTYTGTGNAEYIVEFVQGGGLGEATYRVSEDGGQTWGSTLALSGATIDVYDDVHGSDLGVDTTFTIPPTTIGEAVPDPGNVYPGTATSGGTFTGLTDKTYTIAITKKGALNKAEYHISEDGGLTWGSVIAFGGSSTIDVFDDLNGSDLGVDCTFDDVDFEVGDLFTIEAYAPPVEECTFAAGDRYVVDAFVPTVQEGADAELVVGSGAGQITVTSASNTVTDVLPGLTLNLLKADPGETVQIAVENDTAALQDQVQAFVNSFNGVIEFIRDQTRYDQEADRAGILLGNNAVMKIQQDLRSAVLGTVPGLPAGSNGLYAVGVSVTATGTLNLDTGELAEALEEDIDSVARLFQASGESTNAKIAFVAASGDTVSRPAGYQVEITQAARRGTLTGTSVADPAIAGLTIDQTNDKLVLLANGVSTSVLSLTRKTYQSGAELAGEIAAKIAASDNSVVSVDVAFVDEGATGYFEIRTEAYGSSYTVALGDNPGNSAASVLGLADGTSTDGQDVAGTIDGFEAEGTGRILKATNTNSSACGLQLEVTLGPDEIGGGVSALVSVVKGVAKESRDLLEYLTDPVDGYVKTKEDGFADQLDRYRAQIERKEEILAKRRERLIARFVRLESAISALRNQSSYLSSQLAALSTMVGQS